MSDRPVNEVLTHRQLRFALRWSYLRRSIYSRGVSCKGRVLQIRLICAISIDNFGGYNPFFCTGLKGEKKKKGLLSWSDSRQPQVFQRNEYLPITFKYCSTVKLKKVANATKISNNTAEIHLYFTATSLLPYLCHFGAFLMQWLMPWT